MEYNNQSVSNSRVCGAYSVLVDICLLWWCLCSVVSVVPFPYSQLKEEMLAIHKQVKVGSVSVI